MKLKDTHKAVLAEIKRYINAKGYPPSIRDICKGAGVSSTSVANYYLNQLEEMGYIERDRNVSRGIRVIESDDSSSGMYIIPHP